MSDLVIFPQEDMVFRLRNAYNQDQLETVVSQLIRAMNATTQPQPMTLFPRDLDVANGVLESLIDLLSEELLPSIHTVCLVMSWQQHATQGQVFTPLFFVRNWSMFWIAFIT